MKIKGKKAISLIVLVITILVLSILATTVIISLSNTNIINEANEAKTEVRGSNVEEAKSWREINVTLGEFESIDETIDKLVSQGDLTEEEKEIILGNDEENVEGTGKITIGSRTIVFFEPPLIRYDVTEYTEGGWKLICVYTNSEDVAYKWKDHVMLDITSSGYTYNGKEYKKVYGYVISERIVEDDLSVIDASSVEVKTVSYGGYDIDASGSINISDSIMAWQFIDSESSWLTEESMFSVLKTDVNKDKVLDEKDAKEIQRCIAMSCTDK